MDWATLMAGAALGITFCNLFMRYEDRIWDRWDRWRRPEVIRHWDYVDGRYRETEVEEETL